MRVVVLRVPFKLKVIAQFLADSSLDCIQDMVKDTKVGRVVGVVSVAAEDTGADETGVPAVHVAADDIGHGVVADHVDVLGQGALAVDLLHPVLEDFVGADVGGALGLAVHETVEVETREGLVLGLEGNAECTQVQAGCALVLRWGEQVALREVDGDVAGDGVFAGRVLGPGHELAVGAEQQVEDDLEVGGHVVRLGEDEDGVEFEVGEVAWLGLGLVLLGEVAAQRDCRVPGENVLGVHDVLEAVALCDLADVEALTTADQHVLVVLRQGLHRGVRLDELVGGDGVAQDL